MYELHVPTTWNDNIKLELMGTHLTPYSQMVSSVGGVSDENFVILSRLLNESTIEL
jgi:hypothetical protein